MKRGGGHDRRKRSFSTTAKAADTNKPASTCPDCGKKGYTSKRNAKRAADSLYPGQRMRLYQCGQDLWHMTSQGAAATAQYREWQSACGRQAGDDKSSGSAVREALVELAAAGQACKDAERAAWPYRPGRSVRRRADAAMALWRRANLAVFDAQIAELSDNPAVSAPTASSG